MREEAGTGYSRKKVALVIAATTLVLALAFGVSVGARASSKVQFEQVEGQCTPPPRSKLRAALSVIADDLGLDHETRKAIGERVPRFIKGARW